MSRDGIFEGIQIGADSADADHADVNNSRISIGNTGVFAEQSNRNSTNPLDIDLVRETINDVLEVVISNLSYTSVRSCMGVSKNWRKKALAELLSRKVCILEGCEAAETWFEANFKNTNENFRLCKLQMVDVDPEKAVLLTILNVQKLYLNTLVLVRAIDCRSHGQLGRLLKMLPNLSDLSIHGSRVTGSKSNESARQILPLLDEDGTRLIFENIRRFELHAEIFSCGLHFPTNYLSDIIKAFPNLVEVSITNLTYERAENFAEMSFSRLKHLQIYFNPGNEKQRREITRIFSMLSELHLSLKQLSLRFEPSLPWDSVLHNGDLLKHFIEGQKHSLETLELFQMGDDKDLNDSPILNVCPFPLDLPQLTTLRVQKPFVRNLIQVINTLPKLETLELSVPIGYNWNGILPKVLKEHKNLKILRVDAIDPSSFIRVTKCFPSLTVIQINLWDERLQIPYVDTSNLNLKPCSVCGKPRSMSELPNVHWIQIDEIKRWENLDFFILTNCSHEDPHIFIYIKPNDNGRLQKFNWDGRRYSGLAAFHAIEAGRFNVKSITSFFNCAWMSQADENFLSFYDFVGYGCSGTSEKENSDEGIRLKTE